MDYIGVVMQLADAIYDVYADLGKDDEAKLNDTLANLLRTISLKDHKYWPTPIVTMGSEDLIIVAQFPTYIEYFYADHSAVVRTDR